MDITEVYYPRNRAEWRAWLAQNYLSASEIWLITPNKASGKDRVPYDDAVEEALCFGWIDGIAKKFDADSSAQRFTPRKKKSNLSELNRQRIWKLQQQGLILPLGVELIKDQLGSPNDPLDIPTFIEEALRQDPVVWENFQQFSHFYRRLRVGWVLECLKQRPDEALKRLEYLVKMTAQNKRYGTEVFD